MSYKPVHYFHWHLSVLCSSTLDSKCICSSTLQLHHPPTDFLASWSLWFSCAHTFVVLIYFHKFFYSVFWYCAISVHIKYFMSCLIIISVLKRQFVNVWSMRCWRLCMLCGCALVSSDNVNCFFLLISYISMIQLWCNLFNLCYKNQYILFYCSLCTNDSLWYFDMEVSLQFLLQINSEV